MEENVAKVVGATSSEGFLVARKSVPKDDKVSRPNRPPSKRNTGILLCCQSYQKLQKQPGHSQRVCWYTLRLRKLFCFLVTWGRL